MVIGIETFRDYFKGYENQYILIGGAACDIVFEKNMAAFRATKDLDMVLVVEALTADFGKRFWQFVKDAGYRNCMVSDDKPIFYRFDKPEDKSYPKMIELFGRSKFELKEATGITPIHIDDDISSLSAILLDDDYYKCLMDGKRVIDGLSVLSPEYLIVFKAKAYLDLSNRKIQGERIDSANIKKHKNDILRIAVEMILKETKGLPGTVVEDMKSFIDTLNEEPFNQQLLDKYGQDSDSVIALLNTTFNLL